MGELTNAGYVPERLDAIVAALDRGFRQIYGDDINTDPDSPDGQMIGLIAQARADLEELGEAIYRALDPDHASGAWLEQRAAYAGITRRAASYSYLRSATLVGIAGTLVHAGALIEDENRIQWQLIDDAVIGPDVRVDFRSVGLGKFGLGLGANLKIVTIVLGWEGVTLTAPASEGEEEERDPVLRARFLRSRSRPAQNCVDAIESRVGELADVSQVVCLENITDAEDADGVPGHSVNVIVDGGEDEAIARVILDCKPGGTGMRGDTLIELLDTRGRARKIWFDRPAPVDCAAYIEVERNANYTAVDTDAIKAAIVGTVFTAGQDVQLSRLYTPINTVPGFSVSTLTIGRAGDDLAGANIAIGVREKARFAAGDIEVIVL